MNSDEDMFGNEINFKERFEYTCQVCDKSVAVFFGEEPYIENIFCMRCANQKEREHALDT